MEALPIYLDAIVPSAYAILISVIAVLFFGEVIPQAVWTGPQQIKIGAYLAPVIQGLKIALGIVAYPIAKILDVVLGEHMTTRYTNNDLKALIELHTLHTLETIEKEGTHKDDIEHKQGLMPYQSRMIKSVIDSRFSSVTKIMIPSSKIFSLNIWTNIDNRIAKKIMKAGYSRIPVYEANDKNKIIGIMLIKTLIGLGLTEAKSISWLVNEGLVVLRKPIFVSPDEDFETLLHQFSIGKSHMAIVSDDPNSLMEYGNKRYEDVAGELSFHNQEPLDKATDPLINESIKSPKVLGLLTLEDLIEYIIKVDIHDEGDYDRDLSLNKDQAVKFKRANPHDSLHDSLHDIHNPIAQIVHQSTLKFQKYKLTHSRSFQTK